WFGERCVLSPARRCTADGSREGSPGGHSAHPAPPGALGLRPPASSTGLTAPTPAPASRTPPVPLLPRSARLPLPASGMRGRPSAGRLQRAVVAVDLLVRAAPLRDVLLDLVRGERVARLRVVQRLREDHAVDLALGRQQGAAGVALTHRRVEGVHVAADRAPV